MVRYFAALSLALASPAFAQNVSDLDDPAIADETELSAEQAMVEQRAADAVAVFTGSKLAEDVFADSFLEAVSKEQLLAINTQLSAQFGPLIGVESVTHSTPGRAAIVLRFEKALGSGAIAVSQNAPHKITELLLSSFDPIDDSLGKVTSELNALPGDVGVLFTRLDKGAKPILAIDADRQFAIGSTFKLYVLSALTRSIENGDRNWADVITLDRKSFPSGQLQNWPEGSPLTLHTLATLMISISDNTATDLLIHELGRDTVEAEVLRVGHSNPKAALPFLTTLEMFALKGSEDNMRKYIAGNETTKRAILADFEDDIGGNPDLITPPRFTDPTEIQTLEWFASGRDLQKLAARLSNISNPEAREIMAVNTVFPKSVTDEWLYAGYKGGSEPGVLNLTWLLQDEAERWYILTLSWNNTEENVDLKTLLSLAQRLLPYAYE